MYVTDNEAVREYFTFTYTDKETEIIRKIRIYYFFFLISHRFFPGETTLQFKSKSTLSEQPFLITSCNNWQKADVKKLLSKNNHRHDQLSESKSLH